MTKTCFGDRVGQWGDPTPERDVGRICRCHVPVGTCFGTDCFLFDLRLGGCLSQQTVLVINWLFGRRLIFVGICLDGVNYFRSRRGAVS